MAKIPYECSKCGANGCKLWRQCQTFADSVALLCAGCAEADQAALHELGWQSDFVKNDGEQIGWLVPAVLTDDGETFWGYTSVPAERCNWWWGLPPRERAPEPIPPGPSSAERWRARSDENIAAWTKEAVFLVEATSYEQLALWSDWAVEGARYGRPDTADRRVAWEQLNPGFAAQAGKVGEYPVIVSVQFVRIEGCVVAFYEATSRVVDHEMVEEWVEHEFGSPKWDGETRTATTNAMNFGHCVSACRAIAAKRTSKARLRIKLTAMTVEHGCTPAEAATARRIADELGA